MELVGIDVYGEQQGDGLSACGRAGVDDLESELELAGEQQAI